MILRLEAVKSKVIMMFTVAVVISGSGDELTGDCYRSPRNVNGVYFLTTVLSTRCISLYTISKQTRSIVIDRASLFTQVERCSLATTRATGGVAHT
jgi:hypothetical protein